VAAATGLPLWWLGVANALGLGVAAGVLNVLPILGPTIAIVLVTATAFLQFQTLEITLAAGGIATAVAAIEGNVITPVLTSRAGELNTVAVFLAVLFWGWAWGLWGLLLAIPIMVATKAAADRIDRLHPIGELLGR
jgi:predicted PurR-regulated permease PerM